MSKKGIFISFEGPEASGKSSQLIKLKKFSKFTKEFMDSFDSKFSTLSLQKMKP